MIPANKSKPGVNLSDSRRTVDAKIDDIPTKEEILSGIRDGYAFVMSGGKGQPIDDVHREIAEELAREESTELYLAEKERDIASFTVSIRQSR